MDKSDSALQQLTWTNDDILPKRPPIDEFPLVGHKTVSGSILKKMGDNILVPLGLAATVACLTMGLVSMKRGDSQKQQLFMRGRVGFQMFTFIAMTSTLLLTAKKRDRK